MEYKNINDYEIIYMIRESSEDAYNLMYKKYKPLISKMAFSIINKFNNIGIDYNDLFQEGMIALSEAIDIYNPSKDSLFYSFAYLFIKRRLIKVINSSLNGRNSFFNSCISLDESISDDGLSIIDIIPDTNSLDNSFFRSYDEKKILDLKYELKDEYSLVYELKLNGFSNCDIASLLDLRYKDVDNYLRSIKLILRKKVNNLSDIDFSVL